MIGFDTSIPIPLVCTWAALIGALLLFGLFPFRHSVEKRYLAALAALRLGMALTLTVLLLQPYHTVSVPDRDRFRVALLADCSRSMALRDCRNQLSRFEILRKCLLSDDSKSLRDELAAEFRIKTFLFSEKLLPADSVLERELTRLTKTKESTTDNAEQRLRMLPGNTALGDAAQACLDEFSSIPLGAVVILSDGNSNSGQSPTQVCKTFRSRGIPVSCVGIGEPGRPGDVAVRFTEEQFSGVKDQPIRLNATITNTMQDDVTAHVSLAEGSSLLEERNITVTGSGQRALDFTLHPWRGGYHTYAIRIDQIDGDSRRDTDTDYAAVTIDEPDSFSLLYLGAHLNWEYRFLKILSDSCEQFSLAAVIRTGPQSYYTQGMPDRADHDGFPEKPGVLNEFDAILLDTRALAGMSKTVLDSMVNFVDNRGGGLLCFGPLQPEIHKKIEDILPVFAKAQGTIAKDVRMTADREFIFDRDPGGFLHTDAGIPLSSEEPLCLPENLKKGARTALALPGTNRVALAAQRYGSGRVAFLGFENSWRWRLQNPSGEDLHEAFWNAILVWLGSTSKQRIRVHCAGTSAGVGEALPLDVTILGTDFLPNPDAEVTCTVRGPSGRRDMVLDPSGEAPGRYSAVLYPEQPGEHELIYTVKSDTERFEHTAHFLTKHIGAEAEDPTYSEATLRDMARITQGRFRHYSRARDLAELPLSRYIPYNTTRKYWSNFWLSLLLLVAFAATDWYCRRRIGLK